MAANVQAIRGIYEAFARGDVPGVLATLDPAVEWTQAEGFPLAGTYRGHDAVVQGVFVPLATDWDGFSVTPEEFIDGGDTVVTLGRYSGTWKGTTSDSPPPQRCLTN